MSHIIGKVYDLTQENFNKAIRELEEAQKENNRLRDRLRNSGRELYGVWSEIREFRGEAVSASIYAPDYLRNQNDKQLHLIADMCEEQIKKIHGLQQENKRLRDENERCKEIAERDGKDYSDLLSQLATLQESNKALENALGVYANWSNWKKGGVIGEFDHRKLKGTFAYGSDVYDSEIVGGKTAFEALKQHKQKVGQNE